MPKPKTGEDEQTFISRCIPVLIKEGKDQDQAAAICYSIYREDKSMNKKIKKALKDLQGIIKNMEREEIHKTVINEIPFSTLGMFNSGAQSQFKKIYLDNRLAGKSVEKSLDLTSRLVTRTFKDNQMSILKSIEIELKKILKKKSEFYPDQTMPESWGPSEEDIPVIDEFDEEEKKNEKLGK